MLALNMMPSAIFLLISTALAVPVPIDSPVAPSKINVNHFSKATNQTTSHSIDASALSPALAKTIQGSTVNINFIGERRRHDSSLMGRTVHEPRKINNSTINVTVVGGKRAVPIHATPNSTGIPAPPGTESPSTLSAAGKSVGSHSVLIDASGAKGGIHNSTLNINLHSRDEQAVASTVGHHSILISTEGAQDAAIDSTTMNLNILPRSAPSVGHHSVLLSTASDNGDATIDSTTMNINILPRAVVGDHSILIDTSSKAASAPRNSAGNHSVLLETKSTNGTASAIKNSLINVTVVGGNKNLTSPRMERKPRAGLKNITKRTINPKALAGSNSRIIKLSR